MSPDTPSSDPQDPTVITEEPPAPACVMSFNASDTSGAGGSAGDVATMAAMGAHALPVITSIVMRDSAEVFDQHAIEPDVVVEQARTILEDVSIAAWKVGFLGNAYNVSAVAEILSDYPDVPLVAYMPNLGWIDDDELQPYLEAWRELILPAAEVLVGNHKTLTDFLLPDWDSERTPSARELAVAAGERGTRFVLVTGVMLPAKGGKEQWIDNVLASPQGAITGEKFELFEAGFVGAGDTLFHQTRQRVKGALLALMEIPAIHRGEARQNRNTRFPVILSTAAPFHNRRRPLNMLLHPANHALPGLATAAVLRDQAGRVTGGARAAQPVP